MPHAATPPGVEPRSLLLDLFRVALDAVDGTLAVQRALRGAPGFPHADATNPPRWQAFAVGKAAASMWCGAHAALGPRLGRSLVIVPDGDPYAARAQWAGAEVLHASHPVPDARSVAAGARLFDAVASVPADVLPLFLISGGSSSLVELPRDGVSLEQIQATGAAGLAAGLPIGALNRERAALSRLKGGGLTRALGTRPALALFISDVPDDDTAVIGSGLLAEQGGDKVGRHVVASLAQALAAVEAEARQRGVAVTREVQRLAGDAAGQGSRLAARLSAGPAGLLLAGGETVVTLPPRPGRGGRSQQLALAAALALDGRDGLALLACGTDGIDGASGDAGAVIDGGSCARIRDAGLDPLRQLATADAGTALEAAGDLVHTGPTGTNVCDIVMGLKL